MAAGSTYIPLATSTVSGSSTSQVIFSSISASYTDLIVVVDGRFNATDNITMQFNSDTGTNYSMVWAYSNGIPNSNYGCDKATSRSNFFFDQRGYPDANNCLLTFYVMNYANTNVYKTVLGKTGNPNNGITMGTAVWRSTSAVNSIRLYTAGASNWQAGSILTLYGIAAA